MLDAQIQSGLYLKEDALVNPEDAFFQGPGKVLFFKNSANLATDFYQVPPTSVGPGWLELIDSVEKEISEIVGPEELFGQNLGAKEMTGILLKLKQGAGLIGLRNIFDRLNLSQKICGEITDDLIIENFSPGKVQQILGHEPSEHFFDKSFSKFSCQVEEAELTSSQRGLQFLQAMQIEQLMPGTIDKEYIIEKSPLQDKKNLIERMKKKEQMASEMQHMQALQQMQQQDQLARSLEAKAQMDFAGAKEKETKAISNIALAKYHESEAINDRARAANENAKALHELHELPENRVIKLQDFLLQMQERQAALAGNEEEESTVDAQMAGMKSDRSEQETKVQKAQ